MTEAILLPAAGHTQSLQLRGPVGRIEAVLTGPAGPVRGGVVICHPHPLYGGAMSNKVAYTLASTAAKQGYYALRFNFRGVGKTEGLHDQGGGETDDTVWLCEWLRAAMAADAAVLLAGFSFGAFVSLKAAARAHPAALMSVAPPFGKYFGGEALPPHPGCPWTVLHSHDDEVVNFDDTAQELARYTPPPQQVAVDGCGHFFHGRLSEVNDAFAALLNQLPS